MSRREQPEQGLNEQAVNDLLQKEMHSLTEIGPFFVQFLRAQGMTQRELARRLGVSEAVVSRDVRNQYRGITARRAERVATAMGIVFRMEFKL